MRLSSLRVLPIVMIAATTLSAQTATCGVPERMATARTAPERTPPTAPVPRWQVGAPLPADSGAQEIRDPARIGLAPAPDGTLYVRLDTDILRIAADSARVIAPVAKVARIH